MSAMQALSGILHVVGPVLLIAAPLYHWAKA